MEVVSLAAHTNNGLLRDPLGALEDASKWVRDGTLKATKVMIITLDDAGDNYELGFVQSGMRCTDMLALLDTAKLMIYEEMDLLKK